MVLVIIGAMVSGIRYQYKGNMATIEDDDPDPIGRQYFDTRKQAQAFVDSSGTTVVGSPRFLFGSMKWAVDIYPNSAKPVLHVVKS